MKLLELFSENGGQLSNTRLNTTIAAWVAFSMPIMSMVSGYQIDWGIFVTLLTYSGGTKVFQKMIEEKKKPVEVKP